MLAPLTLTASAAATTTTTTATTNTNSSSSSSFSLQSSDGAAGGLDRSDRGGIIDLTSGGSGGGSDTMESNPLWFLNAEEGGDQGSSSNSGNFSAFNENDNGSMMDENFKQELLEVFTNTTELLRHFYAILNRTGTAAPIPGNATAQKAEAVLNKIIQQISSDLEARKLRLATLQALEKKDASLAVINGISQLIQRAKVTWNIFNQ